MHACVLKNIKKKNWQHFNLKNSKKYFFKNILHVVIVND